MNVPELNLPSDRDAQAALEGYLYQLKLTLLRAVSVKIVAA